MLIPKNNYLKNVSTFFIELLNFTMMIFIVFVSIILSSLVIEFAKFQEVWANLFIMVGTLVFALRLTYFLKIKSQLDEIT